MEGAGGLSKLGAKVRTHGVTSLYHGALAASAATMVCIAVFSVVSQFVSVCNRLTLDSLLVLLDTSSLFLRV